MNFRRAIIVYGVIYSSILLIWGARLFHWQSVLYLAIIFFIGFPIISLFYSYKRWKASRNASLMIISGLSIALFISLAVMLPPWLFPYQDDVAHPQMEPAITMNFSAVDYPSHQIGNEIVSGWVFNVSLFNQFNESKNVVINCTLIERNTTSASFTYYGEREVVVSSNSSLSVEIYIPNAQKDGYWFVDALCTLNY